MRGIRLFAHFITVLLGTFLVLFSSITVATRIGLPTSPLMAVQLLVILVVHIFTLFVVFNVSATPDLDIRVNPYITLCEYLLHRKLPFDATMVELLGQLFGALLASLLFYGVTDTFLGPMILISSGAAFGLEIVAGLFVSWVYFHNYYPSRNLPYTMGSVIGITSAIVFPYIGATTHNPYRYLAACIPAQSCSGAWWVYIFGPLVGIIIGYIIHEVTRYNKKVR